MNTTLRIIFFAITLTFIITQETGILFQEPINFLQLGDDGYPVTLDLCMDNPIFKVTQKAVQPPTIIKGKSIRIIVAGVMINDQVIQKLHLDTLFNGNKIYTAEVDKKNIKVAKGKWQYDYEASVPAFTPSGHWEIFMYIVNDKNENISCVKGIFDTTN